MENHHSGKSNDDVSAFYSTSSKNIQYFPHNLENVFRNLKGIHIYNDNLKEIHQSDLKPFPQLQSLYLHYNKIEVIEDGLFDYNLNLKLIYLSNNKIFDIAEDVFSHLPKLTYLYLATNLCINMNAENNRATVVHVIKTANSQCISGEFRVLSRNLARLEDEAKVLDSTTSTTFHNSVIEAKNELEDSKFKNYASLNERIANLEKVKVVASWELKGMIEDSEKNMNASLINFHDIFNDEILKFEEVMKNSTEVIANELKEVEGKLKNSTNIKIESKVNELTQKIGILESIVNSYVIDDFQGFRDDLDKKIENQNVKIDMSGELNSWWKIILTTLSLLLTAMVVLCLYKIFIINFT